MQLIWQIDPATRIAARNFPVHIHASSPHKQASAQKAFHPSSWQKHLRQGDQFPPGPILGCRAALIIGEFRRAHYLQALALTIFWGTMQRRKNDIYRQHGLQHIYNRLDQCAQSIKLTHDIQQSWNLLTNGLGWSHVTVSKTLHFLCRALGAHHNPPVPIDNDVILKYVWPGFRIGIPLAQRPHDWSGDGFPAYCRYMTAIIEWANQRKWTTTQVENTIYAENI
jgi:hypothetical protein